MKKEEEKGGVLSIWLGNHWSLELAISNSSA